MKFHTAFLRTPKSKEDEGSALKVIRSAQMEMLLAITGAIAAVVMIARAPSFATGAIGILLLFQAGVYANGPWASAAAERVHLTPIRQAYKRSAQSTGAWPAVRAGTVAFSAAAGIAAVAVMFLVSLATPPARPEPNTQSPLLQPPTTIASPTGSSPSASPSGSPSPSPSPSSSPSPSPSPSPSASPSPS